MKERAGGLSVSRNVPHLLEAGYITQPERGKYALTEAGREALAKHSDADTATSAGSEGADRHDLRKKFWQSLFGRPKMKGTRHAGLTPGEHSWIGAGSGVRGLPFSYVIGQNEGKVELYIDRGPGHTRTNKRIIKRLHRRKEEIEKTFGGSLSWQPLKGKRACRIAYTVTAGGYRTDQAKWPDIQDAMIDAMIRLEKTLAPYLAKLKRQLAPGGSLSDTEAVSEKRGQGQGRGARYNVMGHPVTAVLRWMGAHGWSKADALKVLSKLGCPAADSTVYIQVSAGAKGERGEPAGLTPEQAAQLEALRK
jgi:hypothetical protein